MQIPIFMATKRIELGDKHLFRLLNIMWMDVSYIFSCYVFYAFYRFSISHKRIYIHSLFVGNYESNYRQVEKLSIECN